jgi:Zn-dependent protease/CBS domain-containing protein
MNAKNIKLFRLFGFSVGVDPSWILLAVLVAWSLSTGFFPFYFRDLPTGTYWIMGVIGTFGLFLSIVVHEFFHSIVARRRGVPMKGITLFLFGGMAEMHKEPVRARDEFWIAVVGPISSVGMAGLFYLLAYTTHTWSLPTAAVLQYLGMINLLLAIFNMVPAFPLDGGRILRAALWGWKGNLRWATRVASRFGVAFGIILIVLGIIRFLSGAFINGMWLFLIGLFIQSAAKMSYQQLLTRRALEGEPLDRFMKSDPVTVSPQMSIGELVNDYFLRRNYKLYPVVQGGRLVGCITSGQVKEVPRKEWDNKTVAEIATQCSPDNTIEPKTDAIEALAAMRRNNTSRLMVVRENRLIGIITLKDMLEFLSMKIELEEA